MALTLQGETEAAVPVLQAVLASGIHNQVTLGFAAHFLLQALLATGRLAEAQVLRAAWKKGGGRRPPAFLRRCWMASCGCGSARSSKRAQFS